MKYFCPKQLIDLLEMLPEFNEQNYTILAGGTDLLPRYEQNYSLPDHLIDIKHVPELRGINKTEADLEIGALVTIAELLEHPIIKQNYPAIWQAAHQFAGVQIRHRATIGGNICNASPAGDLITPLIALNARILVARTSQNRILPIADFLTGPGQNLLQPHEILVKIILPESIGNSVFHKVGLRQAMAISVVNLAISYSIQDGVLQELNIAAGAVAPTVIRLPKTRDAILDDNCSMDDNLKILEKEIAPITDLRATARYRHMVLKNLLRHCITNIMMETNG